MAFSPYIQNVATFLCQSVFMYNWQPQQTAIFLKGYQEFRALSRQEFDILFDCVRSRFALLILAFTKWKIDFGAGDMNDGYINDAYTFMQRFLSLGKREFDRHLLSL